MPFQLIAMLLAPTISLQLAKNLLLAGEPPSLTRRLKEAILAYRMENSPFSGCLGFSAVLIRLVFARFFRRQIFS